MDNNELKRKLFDYFKGRSMDVVGDEYLREVAECIDVPCETAKQEKTFDEAWEEVFEVFCQKMNNLTLEE